MDRLLSIPVIYKDYQYAAVVTLCSADACESCSAESYNPLFRFAKLGWILGVVWFKIHLPGDHLAPNIEREASDDDLHIQLHWLRLPGLAG